MLKIIQSHKAKLFMFNYKNLIFSLFILTVFTGAIIAQLPPAPPSVSLGKPNSSKENQVKDTFVSVEGGFTIALPQYARGFSNIKPNSKIKGGSQYNWQTPEGMFAVTYSDPISIPLDLNLKNELQAMSNKLIEQFTSSGGKLISTKEISSDGNTGVEVKIQFQDGIIGVTRYFLINNRMFILSAGWNLKEDGAVQLKILDSFKAIDGKAIIAKKLEEATPKPLPQEPVAKKLTTDAQDERLKGKVKSVIEEEEDLTGNWSVSGIKMSTEDYYNEQGNKIKRIFYDYKGNPLSVSVYGYIDGARVSKSGSLHFEYNPPIMAVPLSSAKAESVKKPADTRYTTKYEYKYDEKGRLIESLGYANNGELNGKTVFVYNGNKIEESSYNREGKLTSKTIDLIDEKGNVIEWTYLHSDSKFPDTKYTYTYESFDEKGNWTKRIVFGKEGQYGGGYKDQHYIEYRRITYYQ